MRAIEGIRRGWRARALVLGGAMCLLPLLAGPARAQLAPVVGSHHAARASDTGFQGTVNVAVGGYAAEVPLNLPAARDDLPLPLKITYGGGELGAAGLGWSLPLNAITREITTAHRRAAPGGAAMPKAAEQYTLELDGARIRLVRNAANTAWVASRGDEQLEVRANGEGLLVMYDGAGRAYHFSSQGAQAGSRLMNGNLYLLRSIVSASGNRAELGYAIGAPALPGGGAGLSIDLTSLTYNASPSTANCFKHKVLIGYDGPAATPLAATIDDGAVITRSQKITAISVRAKDSCAAAERILATYSFAYQPDADTRLPRLQAVTMTGRQGTPEQNITLPVASYGYGAIVDGANRITYQKVEGVGLPNLPVTSDFNLGYSVSQSATAGGALSQTTTHQGLIDLNGDGRSDFYTKVLTETQSRVYVNTATAAAATDFGFGYSAGNPALLAPTTRNFRVAHSRLDQYADADASVTNDGMTQLVDMNGDGRLDLVSAGVDQWTIRLNVADPGDPRKSQFVDRVVDVSNLREVLTHAGHLPGLFGDYQVPLTRTTTVQAAPNVACWRYVPNTNSWLAAREDECAGLPTPDMRKKSVIEFELADVNGDGYPDFVYNASRVTTIGHLRLSPPPLPNPPGSAPAFVATTQPSDLDGSRDIRVLLNTAGARLGENERLFASRPVTLEAGAVSGCGISRWEVEANDASGGKLNQTCGLQDINGDGLPDRFTLGADGTTAVKLGTGNIEAPFTAGAVFAVPGPVARNETAMVAEASRPGMYQPAACAATDAIYYSRLMATLRDINADGRPDYLRATHDGTTLEVRMGTGLGFAPAVSVINGSDAQALALSQERSPCSGRVFERAVSGTVAGLHELDGDGQPEFLRLNIATRQWEVYQLKPAVAQTDVGARIAAAPAAGRLTRIDRGHGALTTIGYRSAKEEWNSAHQVPFAEIVVESVGTKDSANQALLATTRYAYRGARMIFDPAQDAFRFPGYQRAVTLRVGEHAGEAIVTETNPLPAFMPGMDVSARFARYLTAGLVNQEITLSGDLGNNPWELLNVDLARDTRRTAGTHYEWGARQLPSGVAPTGNERCIDLMYPYDLAASRNNALPVSDDTCVHRGFMYQRNVFAWRGYPGDEPAPTTRRAVQTNTENTSVDDWGRVTATREDNDLNRADDDVCVDTVYAEPQGNTTRVLNAPARITRRDCDAPAGTVLSRQSFEYDTTAAGVKLPIGRVAQGRVTARTVARVAIETGQPIDPARPEIREFDATFDAAGNPLTRQSTREDGARVTTTWTYDAFGLSPTSQRIDAVNASGANPPALITTFTLDPTTNELLATTDANGTRRGRVFDGFGRALRETLTPPMGTEGVLSTLAYQGFALGQSGGRQIVRKVFDEPVPPANAAMAPGRVSTVFIDALGRLARTEVDLGVDYAGRKVIVGNRAYDLFGRESFVADPYVSNQALPVPYGTTYHYQADGAPQCTVRAYGQQTYAPNPMTDEAAERYVACAVTSYIDNQEVRSTFDADALTAGSAQANVAHERVYSAIGQLLRERTVNRATDAPFEDSVSFGYDRLGHMTQMTRASIEDDSELTTRWHYDSLGQVIQFDEPDAASRYRRYDEFGAPIATQWCDNAVSACQSPMTLNRGTFARYDALGRLTHSEDRDNNVAVAETVRDFAYDAGVENATPPVSARNVLGRLAQATAPTSGVSYSYDAFGRVEAEVYVDRTITGNNRFVNKREYRGDGALKTLHYLLPDTAYRDERAQYAYDSAGRPRAIQYIDGALSLDLFNAQGVNDIDALGRLRAAKYGVNTYLADYADNGRRQLNGITVSSPMNTSRQIAFPPLRTGAGPVSAFDAVGRERSRVERATGLADTIITSQYDLLGRIQRFTRQGTTISSDQSFHYDSLGNLLSRQDLPVAKSFTLRVDGVDNDRACAIAFGMGVPGNACNVAHDALGSITAMPTRAAITRTLTYFADGKTRAIEQGAARARFDYDAFGELQRLSVRGAGIVEERGDKHFGPLMLQREETIGGARTAVNLRAIPGPGGLIATRHGAATSDPWTFTFGERRGNRFFTDQTGAFVQDVDYDAFGEVAQARGAQPGSRAYGSAQWNGGDLLASLGLVHLGARLYDPVIGRFMSRDPLIIPRASARTHPYAFAMNDPINQSDPTGLDSEIDRTGKKPIQCEGCQGREVIRVSGTAPWQRSAYRNTGPSAGTRTRGANPTAAASGGGRGGRGASVPMVDPNDPAPFGGVAPVTMPTEEQLIDKINSDFHTLMVDTYYEMRHKLDAIEEEGGDMPYHHERWGETAKALHEFEYTMTQFNIPIPKRSMSFEELLFTCQLTANMANVCHP